MANLEQERGDHAASSSRNHPGDATLIGAEALLGVSRGQPQPPIAETSRRPQREDEDEEEHALQVQYEQAKKQRRIRELKRRIAEQEDDIIEPPAVRPRVEHAANLAVPSCEGEPRSRAPTEATSRSSTPRVPQQPVLPWPPGYPYPYPYTVPGHDLAGSPLLQPREERLDTLPITFKGDTWAHYVEFKMALDILFQKKPRTYSEDNKKVLLASRSLKGRAYSEWTSLCVQRSLANQDLITWNEFTHWLEGLVGSDETRAISAMSQLRSLQQTANTSFMTHCRNWEMIEQELPGALDPLNRAAFFVCSLRPEMRMELTRAGLARDWQDLCEQGERIEASLRHSVAYRGSDTDYPNNQPRRAPKNAKTTSGLPSREPTATS
ncbi:hypothetical protein S40288_11348 [Stachybotrys chartarum IBT 40288]|nr:hypothetical protein S40288_11348 [Stachybotrys chartarum IBT 40288]